MIRSKGIFHTHLVVKDIQRSPRFYCGLFGMGDTGFKDGDLVFLTTPGSRDRPSIPKGAGDTQEAVLWKWSGSTG